MVLISTVRLFLLLSSICSFFNFVCVIPTNIISNTANPINTTNIISRIGISNIPKGSSLLWVHFVLLYAYTILMYLLIFYFWKTLVYWKQRYFVDNSSLHRSFIIQNLPSDMVDEAQISNFLRRYVNLDRDKTILYVFKNSFHFIKHIKASDRLLYKLSLNKQELLKDILFHKKSHQVAFHKDHKSKKDRLEADTSPPSLKSNSQINIYPFVHHTHKLIAESRIPSDLNLLHQGYKSISDSNLPHQHDSISDSISDSKQIRHTLKSISDSKMYPKHHHHDHHDKSTFDANLHPEFSHFGNLSFSSSFYFI